MRFFLWSSFFLALFGLFASSGLTATATFKMEGRIVNAEGIPVEGAEVYFYRSKNVKKPADFISSKTRADGHYEVVLPVGKYWAVAIFRKSEKKFGPLEEGDRHSGEPIEVEVSDHQTLEFEIVDLREAALKVQKRNEELFEVSGRLLDVSGVPIAVSYAMADKTKKFKKFPRYISAWTDASGKYALYMPKGTYYLGGARWYPPSSVLLLEKEITIEKDIDGVDIVVKSE